jgi:hypothetical protein
VPVVSSDVVEQQVDQALLENVPVDEAQTPSNAGSA